MRLARFSELFIDLAHVVLGWPTEEHPRTVVCRRSEAAFGLSLRDWGDRCLFLGCEEPLALDWVRTKLGRDDLFVDVGANIGAYSIAAAVAGARVIAFEPQPGPAHRLQTSLTLNPDAGELTLHRIGLSDRPDELKMYAFEGGTASGNTSVHEFPGAKQSGLMQVDTLDRILASEEQPIRVLKVDVEGHELAVFKGARATLQRLRPDYLVIELAEEHLNRAGASGGEVLTLLNDVGYRALGYVRQYDGVGGVSQDLRRLPSPAPADEIMTVMFERGPV